MAVACVASVPVGSAGAQTISISSGGEPAPHVCHRGSACTLIFSPLVLASDDRIEVMAPFGAPMAISDSNSVAPVRHPCRVSRRQPLVIPMYQLWVCPVPPGARGSGRLAVLLDTGDGRTETWDFDTLVVGRGLRATDKETKVRFRLAGRHLRMQLVEPSDARGEVWGKRLTAVCARRDWTFRRPYKGLRIAHLTWPARQGGASVRFKRPLGAPPRWCLVEEDGGDVAFARFPPRCPAQGGCERG
jgi:hypothetical protein